MSREVMVTISEPRHLPKSRDGEDFEVDYRLELVNSDPAGPRVAKSATGTLPLGFSSSLLTQWGVDAARLPNLVRRYAVAHLGLSAFHIIEHGPSPVRLSSENAPADLPYDLDSIVEARVPHDVILPDANPSEVQEWFDPREIDKQYRPFRPFEEWASTPLDLSRWEHFKGQLATRSSANPELLQRSLEIARRAAAIETGAIEGLYPTDRGFTFTIATQAAHWEAALDGKGHKAKDLIESQLAAYDYLLDFVTNREPIVEAWIRELHARLCERQGTYTVFTRLGPQEVALPLGVYKSSPNHVRTREGLLHAYAPVEVTPMEMHRLCEEMRSRDFQDAHPLLQAAYVHHAFTAIHPFPDGNGRVARALASVYTYRDAKVPLLVFSDTKPTYFDTLAPADNGDFAPFLAFIANRAVDALLLVDECLAAALAPPLDNIVESLNSIYLTPSGLTHEQVDKAAYVLVALMKRQADEEATALKLPEKVRASTVVVNDRFEVTTPGYRAAVVNGPRQIHFSVRTGPPAIAVVDTQLYLEVPNNASMASLIFLRGSDPSIVFSAALSDLLPQPTIALQMRVSVFVRKVLGGVLASATEAARKRLREAGY